VTSPTQSQQIDKETLAKQVQGAVREVPDFPKPGINFYDITTILGDSETFSAIMDYMVTLYEGSNIEAVAGMESRGFVFGAPLALRLNCPFIPIRKPGKLPYKTISESFGTEYSQDSFEIHVDAFEKNSRVLLVDDLLATGGTAAASIKLVEKLNAKPVGLFTLIELEELQGREKLGNIDFQTVLRV